MSSRLKLDLVRMPLALVEGCYKVKGDETAMPDHARCLAPEAADSFIADLSEHVVVSDMFRTPESSLRAVRQGRGAQPPSYSLHNYGYAIDLDTGDTFKRMGYRDKKRLDLWLAERGWFCFRGDHRLDFECWHFDYLGTGALTYPYKSDRGVAWAQMKERHGASWYQVIPREIQRLLAEVRCYGGAIDGIIGPRSKEALRAFQRTWGLKENGTSDERTVQTLVYVTAEKTITEMVERPLAA